MKIVYISSSIIPSRAANSVHVMKMCQAFARKGHTIVLIAPDEKNGMEIGVKDVYDFYGVDKCFDIAKLPLAPIKGRGYIYGLMAGKKAKQLNSDVVYCRDLSGAYCATMFGQSVIFESHQPVEESGRTNQWMFKKLLKSSYLKKLVVITNSLKRYYETNYPLENGIIQIAPDGADPVPEDLIPVELPKKGKRLQVGYVGQLYRGKCMEIVSSLTALCPWADFHIVGGLEQDICFWKNECDSMDNLFFYGYVPHLETARYIQAFDVVLLPNQQKVEAHGGGGNIAKWTSPLKAFEYMAAGKPIIASDLPVLREIFEHGQNALLCLPDDSYAWKKELERLRKETELRERLGQNAKKDFLENYTWHARAEMVLCQCNRW